MTRDGDNPNRPAAADIITKAQPTDRQSLWQIVIAPTTWAIHFTLCYITAAVWCAKIAGRAGSLGTARLLIMLYTVVAVTIILLATQRAWRQHRQGHQTPPHDEDSVGDRRRFLGLATLLLCQLSLMATLFTALVPILVGDCR